MSTPSQAGEPLSSRWKDVLVSGAFVVTGWALFEYAAAPAIGVTVASLKFGWNDFLTACWLRKRDPDRGRSAACFWFFVASGLWKITVVAFLLTVLIGSLIGKAGRPARPVKQAFGSSSLLTMSGLALLSVVPVIGAVRARQNGVRVWINGSLHAYRRRNLWPVWPSGRNNARGLLLVSLILPLLVTGVMVLIGATAIVPILIAECAVLWFLARGTVARSPEEAWGSAWDYEPEPFFIVDPPEKVSDPDDEFRAPWARVY